MLCIQKNAFSKTTIENIIVKYSIFSRLVIGFLTLFILVTSVSVYSIFQLSRVNTVTRAIILADNNFLDFYKKLTDALLSETRYEKKYVIMQDKALYENFLHSQNIFKEHINKAISLADTTEVSVLLSRVDILHKQFEKLFSEESKLLQEAQQYHKGLYRAKKERLADNMLEELKNLRQVTEENIFKKIRDLNEAGDRARKIAILFTGASLLIGFILSFFITRSITRPLTALEGKTREVAKGDFQCNLDISSPPEMAELAKAFNFMCNKLKEVDKMKSDFFSMMSHELRTPLTSIRAGTHMLLRGVGGEINAKQEQLLSIISEESNRLIDQVNSVLDLSKMEAGMLEFHFADADLAPMIDRVFSEVVPLSETKNITISKDIKEIPKIQMDGERIFKVLRNLIGNAVKFTPQNGKITVSAWLDNNAVMVSVCDTGPGIPKEQQNIIFDKYHQTKLSNTDKLKGTGLGLAIVKHIITAHGGKVWVESELGQGSTFRFILPA